MKNNYYSGLNKIYDHSDDNGNEHTDINITINFKFNMLYFLSLCYVNNYSFRVPFVYNNNHRFSSLSERILNHKDMDLLQ